MEQTERIYAALSDRMLVTDGDKFRSSLSGHDVEAVAATTDTVLVGTFESGLHRSTDGGRTFERDWPTTAPDAVTSVTVSPADPSLAWAGTEPSAVYRSTDGGATWERCPELTDLPRSDRWSFPPRPDTHHVRWVEPAPDDTDRLYVGVEAGAVVRTVDGGDSWADLTSETRRDPHGMAIHPETPERVCLAAGDGYAETPDGGDTWRFPEDGLAHRYVWSVAVARGDLGRRYVSAASGAYRAHDPDGTSHVYVRDGEDDWKRANDGLPGPEGVGRPVLAAGESTVYALSNHGLFRRAGGTWEPVLDAWPEDARDRLPSGLAVV